MLLTDFYFLISTNPENRYKELKDFARKIGIKPEDLGNINGYLYYPVWSRDYTQKVLKAGVYFVSRNLIKEFLSTGTIKNPPQINVNYAWYAHRGFAEQMIREIALSYGWKIPKHGVQTRKCSFLWTHAWHEDGDFNTFNFRVDKYNSEGIAWINEEGLISEVEIPQEIKDKIIAFRRPIPHYFAKTYKK